MGRMKEWASSQQQCAVCGKYFIPQFVEHKIGDLKAPTCSEQCEFEFKHIMEEMAKAQESMNKSAKSA